MNHQRDTNSFPTEKPPHRTPPAEYRVLGNIADWARAGMSLEEAPLFGQRRVRTGREFVVRQFTPSMSLKTATALSADWHEAVANNLDGPNFVFPDPWFPAARLGDYEILPIEDGAPLYREGTAMHHCVGTYGDEVRHGDCYAYSIRRCGSPFSPRRGSGDGRQRFCASKCRVDFHRDRLRTSGEHRFGGAYDVIRKLPVRLGCKWLSWHGDGEPYRNLSSRFAALVCGEYALAIEEAGLEEADFRPFRFHDMRHLHAVDRLKAGRSIYERQQRLGHSSIKTTEIYLIVHVPERWCHLAPRSDASDGDRKVAIL
jgi:hypothetical protein